MDTLRYLDIQESLWNACCKEVVLAYVKRFNKLLKDKPVARIHYLSEHVTRTMAVHDRLVYNCHVCASIPEYKELLEEIRETLGMFRNVVTRFCMLAGREEEPYLCLTPEVAKRIPKLRNVDPAAFKGTTPEIDQALKSFIAVGAFL